MLQLRDDFILVFVKMLDIFDASCVDVFELYAISLHCKNIVVEPFALNKKHHQLFFLFFVQTSFNNLAFKDFADLMLTSKRCRLFRHFYLALLFI